MPSNFKCDICQKAFNTNQHLSQHKNRKKKCTAFIDNNHNVMKKEFEMLMPKTEPKTEQNMSIVVQEETYDFSKTHDTTSILSNLVTNDVFGNTSVNIPNLIELVMKYKSTLDEQMKYSKNLFALEEKVKFLEHENKSQKALLNKIKSLCFDIPEKDEVQLFVMPNMKII